MNCRLHAVMQGLSAVLLATLVWRASVADDELEKRASWEVPDRTVVKHQIDSWLADQKPDEVATLKIDTIWRNNAPADQDLLDQTALTISVIDSSTKAVYKLCSGSRKSSKTPDFKFLSDEETAAFVRNNIRLYYGRWLSQHDLYDEALEQLDGLKPRDVVDPASLLFYQGVAFHRLLKKEQCLPVLTQLLENEDSLPRRYKTLAGLMVADIKPLKTDSLDEIARMMDDIRRRQELYRSGTRVRKEEEEVLAKLDKLIEELEKQLQQQQQQMAGGAQQGSKQPSNPLDQSVPGGVQGEGNVDPKKIKKGADWGDLPPGDRETVLQDLSKDLPAHFREVIEEYLKKLAKDDQR